MGHRAWSQKHCRFGIADCEYKSKESGARSKKAWGIGIGKIIILDS